MNINKKSYSVAFVSTVLILFLILVSSTASATSPSAITETRITNHGTASNPDIYGDKIVWQDNRNGNWDIYIFDLDAETEIHTTNLTNQTVPAIYGNLVVWEDERNGGHDIYVEDLSTRMQTRISESGEAHNPAIYGNRIVWQDERNGISNIYMYNLSTNMETQITTSGKAFYPKIYGNNIIWIDTRNGYSSDIGVYDLSTNEETLLGLLYSKHPAIYGNRIVYQTDPDSIAIYDLSTSTVTTIVPHDTEYNVAIYGDKVVYAYTDRSSLNEIWMYNLSTNMETQISTSETANSPKVYGNRIVWADWRNEGSDIYMATLGSSLPIAAFSASPTSGNIPLKVTFTDKSTGSPTSWKWTFGDGKTSTSRNPAHTYAKAGKYTVSLTVKNAPGTNTKTIKNYITVKTAPVKPVAAFSASPTSGYAPLKVKFTDKSANSPTSWKWSFGDGKTSTSKSPTYTYSKAGKYTVSLTVKNAAGSSTKTIKNYIVVNALKAPVAAFSASPRSGKAPLKVQFTDKSNNSPTSWKWSFGDGTYSTAKNPVHKYSKAGKYTVSLTVKNAKGSNTKTISGYIVVSK